MSNAWESSNLRPNLQKSQPDTEIPRMPDFMAPKPSSKSSNSALQASSKGLPARETELITQHVAKAMSKPLESEAFGRSATITSQVTTKAHPQANTELINGDGAKARVANADLAKPSTPTRPNPQAHSKVVQANDTTPKLSQDIKDLLDEQRADIDRIAAKIDSLTSVMKTVTASLDYLKFQQKTFAEHETASAPTALADDVQVLTRESQLLTESVAQLRTTPTEFAQFKAELESLKQRVQHVELTVESRGQVASSLLNPLGSASKSKKKHPSTLLGPLSAKASANWRTSAYSLPPDITGDDYSHERRDSGQVYAPLLTSDDEMTPEDGPYGIGGPQITSATKVAARNRRPSSDSSSGTHPPKKRRRPPTYRGKPDWNTKPISLNSHQAVLTSDPEDHDYNPDKDTQEMQQARLNNKLSRPGLMRMPTPEWEKPDWEGPSVAPTTNSSRGKTAVRRGVSGRVPLVDRDTERRRSSGYGNGDYVYFESPLYWEDDSPMSTQVGSKADLFEKPRDSQGRLIRQNGKIDGRSLRHKRAREEKARQAAVQQQLQMTSLDSSHVTEGQQKEMQAMGLLAPVAGPSLVDAAALQAARNFDAASPASAITPQIPTTSNTFKKEKDEIDGDSEANPSTTAGSTAPQPRSDKHAQLMKHVFPWR